MKWHPTSSKVQMHYNTTIKEPRKAVKWVILVSKNLSCLLPQHPVVALFCLYSSWEAKWCKLLQGWRNWVSKRFNFKSYEGLKCVNLGICPMKTTHRQKLNLTEIKRFKWVYWGVDGVLTICFQKKRKKKKKKKKNSGEMLNRRTELTLNSCFTSVLRFSDLVFQYSLQVEWGSKMVQWSNVQDNKHGCI